MERRYYPTIDIARGFGIILVVFGHYYNESMPEPFHVLNDFIYLFHMPLFLFISGFLCVATWKPELSYLAFVKQKFQRLMIPYLSASVIIILIKLATQNWLPVDHPVTAMDFITILYEPSAAYVLWFLWALFWMMCISRLFSSPKSRILLFVLSIAAYLVNKQLPQVLCLQQTAFFLMYFVGGMIAFDIMKTRNDKYIPGYLQVGVCVLFAVLAFVSLYKAPTCTFLRRFIQLSAAFAGTGTTLVLCQIFENRCHGICRKAILSVSASSFVIYLFHTTVKGFISGALNKMHLFDGGHLILRYSVGTIIVVAGCVITLTWLDHYVLRRFKITRRLFALPSIKSSKSDAKANILTYNE